MRTCLVACSLLAVCLPLFADHWPQFRGPSMLGTSDNPNLPDKWSTTENVAWKTPIPGRGWSCPIVWGDKVFLTSVASEGKLEAAKKGLYFGGERPKPSADKHRWLILCLDLNSGKVLWEREVHKGAPDSTIHVKNSYASETPVTDGERIYAYFGNVGLFCYTADGKHLWTKDLGKFKTRFGWGTAASPVLHGDRLYVVNDNEEKSFLVAYDKRTGSELWRVDRDEKSNWATPYVWQNGQRTELVVPGTNKIRSYDPDGKVLWEMGGMSSITIPTPFSREGLLYVTSGYVMDKKKPLFAIKPGAKGDITLKDDETKSEYVAWSQKQAGPYNPSALLYGPQIYVLYDMGTFASYDAKTGEQKYSKQRLDQNSQSFTASPWAYNGKVFCLSEDSVTFVVPAGPEFKVLHKNNLDEMCMSTPAIVGDRLLIRTDTQLYCIRKGK